MAEGVALADGQVSQGVHDDPEHPPAPGPDAPKGWTWNKGARAWKPKVRGPVIWTAGANGHATGDAPAAPDRPEPTAAGPEPDADPDPGWIQEGEPGGKPGGRKHRQSIDDVPKEVIDDMAGFAGLVGAPILAMLQQADPYCGSALAQNFEPIVDAVLPLVCRSKKIVDYFSGDKSDWLLWGKLAIALRPVGVAILQHHVIRSVEVVRDAETGAPRIVRRERNAGYGDHLTPPSFEYAA